jgi:hypothetical protein
MGEPPSLPLSLSLSKSSITAYSLNRSSKPLCPYLVVSVSTCPLSSLSSAANVDIPSALLAIAGVSANGASNRNRRLCWEEGLPGLECLDRIEAERLECPFVANAPFAFNFVLGLVTDKLEGIDGSVRSLRSVMFLRSLSAFNFNRLAHWRRGWFFIACLNTSLSCRVLGDSHLSSIIRVTVGPYEVEVILELPFGFVLLLLHFLQHGLHVHRV